MKTLKTIIIILGTLFSSLSCYSQVIIEVSYISSEKVVYVNLRNATMNTIYMNGRTSVINDPYKISIVEVKFTDANKKIIYSSEWDLNWPEGRMLTELRPNSTKRIDFSVKKMLTDAVKLMTLDITVNTKQYENRENVERKTYKKHVEIPVN